MFVIRLIDTIGFEPSLIQEQKAIKAVKDWSKDCAKKDVTSAVAQIVPLLLGKNDKEEQ